MFVTNDKLIRNDRICYTAWQLQILFFTCIAALEMLFCSVFKQNKRKQNAHRAHFLKSVNFRCVLVRQKFYFTYYEIYSFTLRPV